MFNSGLSVRIVRMLLLALLAVMLAGCSSKQEQALDQAKKQAAASGQAQQVVSVDKNGTTTTIVVQPPAAGQTTQAITTAVTPPTAGAPLPAFSRPVVSAVPQPVDILAGTTLTIRIDQHISVKTSRAGDTFTGEIADPVLATDNSVLVPKGALVAGVVDVSHRRGHFKGRSLLELRLTSITTEWNPVSAGNPRPRAQQEGQGQTFDGLDCRRCGPGHAGGWSGQRRRRAGGGWTGRWWRRNCRRGIDRQPRYRDTGGVDCELQIGG